MTAPLLPGPNVVWQLLNSGLAAGQPPTSGFAAAKLWFGSCHSLSSFAAAKLGFGSLAPATLGICSCQTLVWQLPSSGSAAAKTELGDGAWGGLAAAKTELGDGAWGGEVWVGV